MLTIALLDEFRRPQLLPQVARKLGYRTQRQINQVRARCVDLSARGWIERLMPEIHYYRTTWRGLKVLSYGLNPEPTLEAKVDSLLQGLRLLVRRARGTAVTLTAAQLAQASGLPPSLKVYLAFASSCLYTLAEHGMVSVLSPYRKGRRFVITREHPLWQLRQDGALVLEEVRSLILPNHL